jgi:hypothetical protein
LRARACHEIRPQLGFHDEPHARLEVREERAHRERHVIRQPCLDDTIAEQRAAGRATGRRHVRHQHGRLGMRAAKPVDEWRGGACLAERNACMETGCAPRRGKAIALAMRSR